MNVSGSLIFIKNKVKSESGKSGGVYVENKNRNCEVDINLCMFFWTGQSKIDFIDNYANSGPMIYGGMMDGCTHLQKNSSIIPFVDVISDNGRQYMVKTHGISSESIKFCYCENYFTDCSLRETKRNSSPGQTFYIYLACIDQMEQPVPCHIKSEYVRTDFVLGQCQSVQRSINVTFNGVKAILKAIITLSFVFHLKSMWTFPNADTNLQLVPDTNVTKHFSFNYQCRIFFLF